jgi:hypothetical protein
VLSFLSDSVKTDVLIIQETLPWWRVHDGKVPPRGVPLPFYGGVERDCLCTAGTKDATLILDSGVLLDFVHLSQFKAKLIGNEIALLFRPKGLSVVSLNYRDELG